MRALSTILSSIAVILALAVLPAQGQGLRFSTNAAAPIDIAAGVMSWQRAAGRAQLSQGALIQQGPLRLSALQIELILAGDGTAQNLIATGDIELVSQNTATGQSQRAWADEAVMDLAGDKILLRGNVKLSQSGSAGATLSGGEMTLDMRTGQAQLRGAPGQENKTGKSKKPRARIELH